jgi:hypothetical protein
MVRTADKTTIEYSDAPGDYDWVFVCRKHTGEEVLAAAIAIKNAPPGAPKADGIQFPGNPEISEGGDND